MASLINEAAWDRVLRLVLGAVLLYLGWAGVVAGTPGTILKIVGFIPLLTGLAGYCPLYALLGVSTCPRQAGGTRTPPPPQSAGAPR